MNIVIAPYAAKRIDDSDTFEVAWNEWDGNCMCSKVNKRGTIEFKSTDGFDPDIIDLEKAIRSKYHGDN